MLRLEQIRRTSQKPKQSVEAHPQFFPFTAEQGNEPGKLPWAFGTTIPTGPSLKSDSSYDPPLVRTPYNTVAASYGGVRWSVLEPGAINSHAPWQNI